jgi:hypothetical protein
MMDKLLLLFIRVRFPDGTKENQECLDWFFVTARPEKVNQIFDRTHNRYRKWQEAASNPVL